LCKR